jgi:flagellar motor switch protein FliN/FliY
VSNELELAELSETSDNGGPRSARELEAVYDIPVTVSAVLGKATMQVSQLLKLGRGAVVELDRKLGEAIDIYVNNRLVARGEVVMVDDTRLGVTMTEIVKADRAQSGVPVYGPGRMAATGCRCRWHVSFVDSKMDEEFVGGASPLMTPTHGPDQQPTRG